MVILMATMVMEDLMTVSSRNTVSWVFENVVILIATMVMKDLMTLVK